MSERELISAIKYDVRGYDSARLAPEDIESPVYRQLYQAIGRIIERGEAVDDSTLIAESGCELAAVVSLEWAPVQNVERWAAEIRDKATRRRLHTFGAQIQHWAAHKHADEVLGLIDAELTALSDRQVRRVSWLKDVLEKAVAEIQRKQESHGEFTGIPSGYPKLDACVGGFDAGQLVVVAARPSIGKTALLVSMAANMCVGKDYQIGFFSAEMSEVLLAERMLAVVGRYDLSRVRSGTMSSADLSRLLDAANKIYKSRVQIDDTPNIQLQDLKVSARTMVRQGAQLLMVDYLTLIRHGDKALSRPERVGEVSKSLKQLARELHVPVLVASQLNRQAEGSTPGLEHLRQSGEIEEDSDVVILIDRERGERETVLRVVKNRQGPTDDVQLTYMPEFTRFEVYGGRE